MRCLLFILITLVASCNNKSENTSSGKNEVIVDGQEKNETIPYKEFGKSSILNIEFPKEWEINTYEDTVKKIKKEDLDFQNKFAALDYFKDKGGKNVIDKTFFYNYIKNDSLLKLSKIESFSLLDSIIINQKKLFYIKTSSSIDSQDYEMPLVVSKIDLVMFNKNEFNKSVNLFLEVDYPYSTKQNIGYLDNNGIVYYKKFKIDEDKTYYLGMSKINLNEYFK
ncbi:hypothetical protein [Flavobacterium sp. FlaQc-28]|uniref:hypothetical protein n=1 Tax=Flavobacterium sp. FlaQc-28 TaxID=3374178 RepID=UPI0037579A49